MSKQSACGHLRVLMESEPPGLAVVQGEARWQCCQPAQRSQGCRATVSSVFLLLFFYTFSCGSRLASNLSYKLAVVGVVAVVAHTHL